MENQQLTSVRLDPGELYIGIRPSEVQTVLGSCVAISIYDRRLRIGAICHSRLASRECSHLDCGLKICRNLPDYVTCSLYFMLSYFDQHGSLRRELEVKLFGGANMFNMQDTRFGAIGKRNVEAAMAIIRQERLHLVANDVGGLHSRQLSFSTLTGEVLLRRGIPMVAENPEEEVS